jgi:ABC-type multidrug transport system fused ATPase/permease subunit
MNLLETLRILLQMFRKYRLHIGLLAILGLASAVLEGIGINAVIPLLSSFTGGGASATDPITHGIQNVFMYFGIPFTFRYLLGLILGLFLIRALAMVVFSYIRADLSYIYSSPSADLENNSVY